MHPGRKHQTMGRIKRYPTWPFLFLIPLIIMLSPSRNRPDELRTLPEEHGLNCPSTKPLTVFLHLHKTGGNTMKKALFAFAKNNDFAIHHTCHPAVPDSWLLKWYFRREKLLSSMDCNLDRLPNTDQLFDFIVGHQYVGVHSLFPKREVRYFTFVREPLRRKVAHFVQFEKGTDRELFTYLVERNRNYMTKRLASNRVSGEIAIDLRSRFIDLEAFASRAALRAAKKNLVKRFFFVGLQERFDESVCVLSKVLNSACGVHGRLAKNWKLDAEKVFRASENVRGGSAERLRRVPTIVKTAAKRAEAADVELYRFAEELFERKLERYPECRR